MISLLKQNKTKQTTTTKKLQREFQEDVKGKMIKARMRIHIWEEFQPVWLDSAVSVIR